MLKIRILSDAMEQSAPPEKPAGFPTYPCRDMNSFEAKNQ